MKNLSDITITFKKYVKEYDNYYLKKRSEFIFFLFFHDIIYFIHIVLHLNEYIFKHCFTEFMHANILIIIENKIK